MISNKNIPLHSDRVNHYQSWVRGVSSSSLAHSDKLRVQTNIFLVNSYRPGTELTASNLSNIYTCILLVYDCSYGFCL